MNIKAKFRCDSVTDNGYNKSAEMSAVHGTQGENADFTKATPYGKLSISIDKETKASDYFQPQKEYYLTFEEV